MYLLNNHEDGLRVQNLKPLGDMAIPIVGKTRALFEILIGEEKPRSIGSLLGLVQIRVTVFASILVSI